MPQRYLKYLLFLILLASMCATASAQLPAAELIRGIVRDSLTLEGLPYSSVRLDGGKLSAVTDSRGLFEIAAPAGVRTITASCQGYAPKTIAVKSHGLQIYDINLVPEATELAEVVIKKKRYSKRNNPAVDFVNRLRHRAADTDPRRNDWYSFDTYERISLGINDVDTSQVRGIMAHIPDWSEHIDTSEINGRPVLNLSVNEEASTTCFRHTPRDERRIVRGLRKAGISQMSESDNLQTILAELLREVDLFEPNINLLKNNFVSPLSGLAPDFYRFYLVDSTAIIEGSTEPHIALAFYPRNKSSIGFQGHLYVARDDTAMTVRKVAMGVSPEINLNFIKNLRLEQDYGIASDGSRLKDADRLTIEMQMMPGTPAIYVSRKLQFSNHSFDRPADADTIFGRLGHDYTQAEAYSRDTAFWAAERVLPMQNGESGADRLMGKLRQNKWFYYGERFIRNMFTGYWAIGRHSPFDIGPLNTMASYNDLEGLRLRAGGMTTANLSTRWFGRGYVAYGFRDHKWKYGAEVEYSFIDKRLHPREFPVKSLRLKHEYDIDRLGSHYLYTNADNFVLSLTRMADRRFTYRRLTRLEYTLELNNHFSVVAAMEHQRQESSPYMPFVTNGGTPMSHYTIAAFDMSLRFAPGETFYQARSFRIPVDETVPVVELTHRYSPAALSDRRYGVNRTELSLSKLFLLPVVGALDVKASGGHVWGSTVFPELFIPNANLSYTIQPGSFALMNPLEFINSSYVSWHLTYQARGAIFRLIPGVRRLGLREIVSFCGLYGRRSAANDAARYLAFPADVSTTSMHSPYMEISAGIDNILRFIRLDYVWRLNYLGVPYPIDRHGLRVAMQFTF